MRGSAAKSAVRTFAILELFRQARTPLRLKDITDHLHFPASSAAELLKAAAAQGYLSFDPVNRTYFPVGRLASLGSWISDALYDKGEVLQRMHDLHELAGDGVVLTIVNGFFVEYVEVVPPRRPVPHDPRVGLQRPLVYSGAGWVSLCQEPDDVIEKLYRRSCAQGVVKRSKVTLDTVRNWIDSTRLNRFALTRDLTYENTIGISMALPEKTHGRRLALVVHGPTTKIDRNLPRLIDALTEACASLH